MTVITSCYKFMAFSTDVVLGKLFVIKWNNLFNGKFDFNEYVKKKLKIYMKKFKISVFSALLY